MLYVYLSNYSVRSLNCNLLYTRYNIHNVYLYIVVGITHCTNGLFKYVKMCFFFLVYVKWKVFKKIENKGGPCGIYIKFMSLKCFFCKVFFAELYGFNKFFFFITKSFSRTLISYVSLGYLRIMFTYIYMYKANY